MKNQTLSSTKIAQSVNGLTSVTSSITPAAGKNVKIDVFSGFCPPSANQTIQLLWKAAIVWQFTGPGEMPFSYDIAGADVNGSDQVQIKCTNGAVTAVNMSAYLQMMEFDDE